jgi:hypothetical protein
MPSKRKVLLRRWDYNKLELNMTKQLRLLITNASRPVRERFLSKILSHRAGSGGYWAQHSFDDKTTLAAISIRASIFSLPATSEVAEFPAYGNNIDQIKYAELANMIPAVNIDLQQLHSGTILNEAATAKSGIVNLQEHEVTQIQNLTKLIAQRKQDFGSNFCQTRTDYIDVLIEAVFSLGFADRLPVPFYAFDAFEPGYNGRSIDIFSPSHQLSALEHWLGAQGIEFQHTPYAMNPERQTLYGTEQSRSGMGSASLLIIPGLYKGSIGLNIKNSGIARLLDIVGTMLGVESENTLVFSRKKFLPCFREFAVGDNVAPLPFTFHQRTFKAGSAKNFVALQLSDVFSAGTKCLIRTFPKEWTPTCTNDDLPKLIASYPELKAAGIGRIIIATPGDTDGLHAWVQHAVDQQYQTPGSWLYQNPLAKSATFVEDHFVLVPDQELQWLKNLVPTMYHERLQRQVCARAAIITDGPQIVLKRVEANAAQCVIVAPASLLAELRSNTARVNELKLRAVA